MERIAIADGWVDLDRGRVHRLRDPQPLSPTEVDLLRFLASHEGQVVGRDDLLDAVWGYGANVVTRTLDTAIYRLRKKIEPDPAKPVHLLTVHGKGYRFRMAESEATPELFGLTELRDHRPLIGRDELLESLRSQLEAGARLLTLVGPGGVGKTRLSQRLGHARRTLAFEIESAGTAGELLSVLGGVLEGQSGVPVPSPLSVQSLADAVAAMDAELVVLDNAEQVLEPTAHLVGQWLARPMPPIVVTSREPLGLDAEEVIEVPPLDDTDAAELLRSLSQRHGGWIGGAEPAAEALSSLVQRVDGLPLALELLSPQLAVLSPQQLSSALDEGGLLLGAELADGRPDRHRTLGDAVQWSWRLLAPPERSVVVALATISGAADFPALRAVHSPGDSDALVLGSLAKLRKHRLVRVELETTSASPVARYRLVVGVREFACGTDDYRAERDAFWRRHADHYLGRADDEGLGDRHVVENLHAIRARGEGLGAPTVARAARLVARHALRRGPFALAVEALAGVLPPDALSEAEGATLWLESARAKLFTGDLTGAEEAVRRSRALDGDAAHLAVVEGRLLLRTGEAARAVERLSAGLDAAERAGDAEAAARAQADLGSAFYETGRFDAALVSYDLATRRFERLGWRGEATSVRLRRAIVEMDAGRLNEARVHCEDALRETEIGADERRRGIVLSNLGVLLHELGDRVAARERLEQGLEVHRALGHRRFVGFSLAGRGFLAVEEGRDADALVDLRESLQVFREVNEAVFEPVVAARIGLVDWLSGRLDSARVRWAEARRLFRGLALDWGVRGTDWLERRCEGSAPSSPANPSQFERLNQRVAAARLES